MFLINSCIFCLSVSLSKVFDDFQQAENMLETLTLSFITDKFNFSEDNRSANDDFHLQNITIKTSHPHTDFKKCVTRTEKKRQNLFLLNRMQNVFFIQFLPESLIAKLTFFVKRGENVFCLSSYHSFLSPSGPVCWRSTWVQVKGRLSAGTGPAPTALFMTPNVRHSFW